MSTASYTKVIPEPLFQHADCKKDSSTWHKTYNLYAWKKVWKKYLCIIWRKSDCIGKNCGICSLKFNLPPVKYPMFCYGEYYDVQFSHLQRRLSKLNSLYTQHYSVSAIKGHFRVTAVCLVVLTWNIICLLAEAKFKCLNKTLAIKTYWSLAPVPHY